MSAADVLWRFGEYVLIDGSARGGIPMLAVFDDGTFRSSRSMGSPEGLSNSANAAIKPT